MKNEKKKTSQLVSIAVMLVAGGAIGYLGAQVGVKAAQQIPGVVMATLVVLLIPAFLLVIAIHEGGHALAGTRVAFDFRTYVVGPFLWDKQPDGWKFMWNKNINTSGGLVICIPTGTHNLAKRFMIYVAGGPLASLALALVAGIVFMLLRGVGESVIVQIITYFFSMLAFLSAAIFLITSLPLQAGGFSSDGARVLRLLRGGDKARFEILMLKMVSSSMAGMRPAQLNKTELEEASQLGERLQSPMVLYIAYYLYLSTLDRNQVEEAEQYLQVYINNADDVPEGLRGTVWLEAAFFYALVRGDLQKAEKYFQLYKPSALTPLAVEYATRAAMAKLKGESAGFSEWILKAKQALPNMMDKGAMLVVQDKLDLLNAEKPVNT
ncbi:MAG: hypothetical protein KF856_09420 [Cyclobacteriaceae bacterium]|nr:hypothetical protein [Cyclobacteriaceae bacterium]